MTERLSSQELELNTLNSEKTDLIQELEQTKTELIAKNEETTAIQVNDNTQEISDLEKKIQDLKNENIQTKREHKEEIDILVSAVKKAVMMLS